MGDALQTEFLPMKSRALGSINGGAGEGPTRASNILPHSRYARWRHLEITPITLETLHIAATEQDRPGEGTKLRYSRSTFTEAKRLHTPSPKWSKGMTNMSSWCKSHGRRKTGSVVEFRKPPCICAKGEVKGQEHVYTQGEYQPPRLNFLMTETLR